jgi:hypothetical protein
MVADEEGNVFWTSLVDNLEVKVMGRRTAKDQYIALFDLSGVVFFSETFVSVGV